MLLNCCVRLLIWKRSWVKLVTFETLYLTVLSWPSNKILRKNVAYIFAHFNENLPLVRATDTSYFVIEVVLSHIQPDGKEYPIVFAPKTLDKQQVNYSQIEKDGIFIIFGVKSFHQYLYGRKFTLITNQKPLVTIFNPGKHLPLMTSNRLKPCVILLVAYNFAIQYRSTSAHGNANALSRLPVGTDVIELSTALIISEILRKGKTSQTGPTVCY